MIKISNQNKHTTQNFCLFTEADWELEKSNYSNKISLFFSAKKSQFFVDIQDHEINYLIGFGAQPQDFEVREIAQKLAFNYKEELQNIATSVKSNFSPTQLSAFVEGLFLGTYQYPFQASHTIWQEGFNLIIPQFDENQMNQTSLKAKALCEGQFAAMDWINKPANQKKVSQISNFLEKTAEKYNLSYKAFNREESRQKGLGAFVAVNQGSSQDAAFTILEYQSSVKDVKTVGLVGKCVLFDTGGISIKSSANLHYMKSDLGGATAVIGALITAAELQLPVNIVAILPITDNAVSNEAYLPSDVITAYNGKTIEVLDTDAEGRMTLADGLSYLTKNYKTDAIIDLATLTGSAVRMFGTTCGAMFSNNSGLKNQIEKSADTTNQRLWNLPLWDIWKDDFSSDVADYKNISLKPYGDCIVAAKFLEQFINEHPSWAHLDIAGMVFGNVNYAKEKAATGYGVQLLINFLEQFNLKQNAV
ncbi:M17 family metallopeptidase [Chryseobacterium sp. T1]